MTKLLKKALEEVRKLPSKQQDVIASVILDEIAEAAKKRKPAKAKSRLDELVEEAERQIAAGEVSPLEFPRRR